MAVKRIYIGMLLLLNTAVAVANSGAQSVQITDVEFAQTDSEITVKFTLQAGQKAAKGDYTLVVLPLLKNDEDSTTLPEIAILGKRARIAEARNRLATEQNGRNDALTIRNGGKLWYTATIPYQEWMQSAQLVFNGIAVGCCSVKEVKIGTIVEFTAPDVQEMPTTGDLLSHRFPFLSSIAFTHSPTDMESFINHNREGALMVYFVQGGRVIDRAYKNNNETLVKLVSVVRAIESSPDTRIAHIVIAGFASPEGSLPFNEQLAWDRGIALSRFVAQHTSLPANKIYVYGGSVDWAGLREIVDASDMYEKRSIIDIIDAPEWNKGERLHRLMRLSDGQPYRYMLTHFFPLLRNAAYVKVYYENL